MTYNFCAGPAVLADEVLKRVQSSLLDFKQGISILSISHRDEAFEAVGESIKLKLRKTLDVPETHDILLMQGGATLQFSAIPLNFGQDKKVAYINTGIWSQKAIDEAKKCSHVIEVDHEYESARSQRFDDFSLKDVAYLHYTDNETIDGVEFSYIPNVSVPLVCDMSSSFLSKPVDISKFDLIYAGAQKNIGPAGVTVVIIKKEFLEKASMSNVPVVMDYPKIAKADSLLNTPVTVSWQVVDFVLDWFVEKGGIPYFNELNQQKSDLLYQTIDQASLFSNVIQSDIRSRMNIVFQIANEEKTDLFLDQLAQQGFYGLKGHRSVGGCRASLYNAMTLEGVQALSSAINAFDKLYK